MKLANKILAVAAIAVTALVAWGYAFNGTYQCQPEVIQMAPGDTLWAISEKYYPQNEDGACFDDFNTRLCDENKALWANGRVPQPGDKVIVPLRKKVENDD